MLNGVQYAKEVIKEGAFYEKKGSYWYERWC